MEKTTLCFYEHPFIPYNCLDLVILEQLSLTIIYYHQDKRTCILNQANFYNNSQQTANSIQ